MNVKHSAAHAVAIVCAVYTANAVAQTYPVNVNDEQIVSLPSIVVTATTRQRTAANAPASVSVIDGVSLRRRPVNDLADALRGSVGVGLENVGLGRRGISIRGMSSEHTLMLIDGQRINSSSAAIAHSDFELGWMPTEAMERVEVVRGPLSSLYGSEALGGVVNVISRTATDHWQGSLSGSAMINDHGLDGNQYKSGFYLGGPLVEGKLGLNVWGEYRYRDALQDADAPRLTALDEQRATTGHIGVTWTPDSRQRIDLSVTAGEEDQEGIRGSVAVPYSTEYDVERRRYSLAHRGDWGWGSTQFRLYRSTLERNVWRSDGNDSSGPNRFEDTVLDGRTSFDIANIHTITLGMETRRESLEDPSVNRAGKKALTHYAFFIQDEIALGDKWELVLGSRFDHHEDFGWEVSPRAYLLFHPTSSLTFKAGAGRGFKAPTLKQLSSEYESWAAMGGRGIIRGNPDLQPETNRSYELGAEYNQGRWAAGLTLFRNDVRNLIETVRQPTCDVRGRVCLAYENLSRTRLQGVELTMGADLSTQWRVDANYTYLHARDTENDLPLADRSRHRANATLTWAPNERFSTQVQVEHIGSQYRSAILSERPSYTMFHWYANYEAHSNLSLYVGIENITDKQLANDDADIYGRADEGRRYFAGFTARF